MNDKEIVNLYYKRKESAITATSEKYGSYCYTISYNILHNNSDSEECVNDTYLKAWETIPPEKPTSLGAYLGKITRNLSINRLKHNRAKKRGCSEIDYALSELEESIPSSSTVEKAFDEKELIKALNSFLLSESEINRNIFIRRYWYLYSIRSISVYYDMGESKVTSLLFRMRKKLKKHLEKEEIYL